MFFFTSSIYSLSIYLFFIIHPFFPFSFSSISSLTLIYHNNGLPISCFPGSHHCRRHWCCCSRSYLLHSSSHDLLHSSSHDLLFLFFIFTRLNHHHHHHVLRFLYRFSINLSSSRIITRFLCSITNDRNISLRFSFY